MTFLLSKSGRKFLFATILMGIIIIGGVTAALFMLREEAIKTHLKLAQLHARTFGDHLSQTLLGINLATENLTILSTNGASLKLIDKSLDDILRRMPYIRSLTLLDENGEAIVSTNKKNIGVKVTINNFIPVPFLDEPTLRFGIPWKGRDLFDGLEISSTNGANSKDVSFVPIIKSMTSGTKKYTLLIALNSDFFINRYSQSLTLETGFVDVARIDGVLMFSTDESVKVGSVAQEHTKMFASGKDTMAETIAFGGKESLTAYQLTSANPIGVVVRLDYKNTLSNWEKQRINVLLVTTALVVFSAILTLILMIRHKKQQAMEAEILKSKIAAMSELISMIAHQWRQPLAIMSGIFANIVDAYEYGELTKEYLEENSKQSSDILRYMSKTIDDFGGFFRPHDSKGSFCLYTATMDAIRLALDGMSNGGAKIYLNDTIIDENSRALARLEMPVLGYRNEFMQALISMFKNSQDAIERNGVKNGAIYIKTEETDSKYLLHISDNGGGVAQNAKSRLFEPYYTTKHSSMGTGMGLYVAKMLVENNMDGKISFKDIDGGTLFTIELDKLNITKEEENV
jgi:signal transduction histidine kinase